MPPARHPPLLLVVGPVPDATWQEPLLADGWLLVDETAALADRPLADDTRTVVVVTLRRPADVTRILRLALAGLGIVCRVASADRLAAALHEDLRRVGPVRVMPDDATDQPERGLDPPAPPVAETLLLLQRLSVGQTLGDAAKAGHMSRRTADRRLAAVRRSLGVATTLEAVMAARGSGWLGPASEP